MTHRALGSRARRARVPVILAAMLTAIACGEVLEPSTLNQTGMAFAVARPAEGASTASVFGAGIDTVFVQVWRPNESVAAETTVMVVPLASTRCESRQALGFGLAHDGDDLGIRESGVRHVTSR